MDVTQRAAYHQGHPMAGAPRRRTPDRGLFDVRFLLAVGAAAVADGAQAVAGAARGASRALR